MAGEWLNLSKAAILLGVHPSTVRNWSDQGVLPVHRTQGGHRRYLRSEIELWIQSQRADGPTDFHLVAQTALKSTRFQISEGHLNAESWYRKLGDEDRNQYRKSGRALLQGLINFINADGVQASSEAQALGYEYASRGRRCGLSLQRRRMPTFSSATCCSNRCWRCMNWPPSIHRRRGAACSAGLPNLPTRSWSP